MLVAECQALVQPALEHADRQHRRRMRRLVLIASLSTRTPFPRLSMLEALLKSRGEGQTFEELFVGHHTSATPDDWEGSAFRS